MTTAALLMAIGGAVLFSSKSIFIKLAYAIPGLDGAPPVDAVTLLTLRMIFSMPFFVVIGILASRNSTQAEIDVAIAAAQRALAPLLQDLREPEPAPA